MSNFTHNRPFLRWIIPGNGLYLHWQPKTRKQNTTHTLDTKEKQKNTALINRTNCTLIWYASGQETDWAWSPYRVWELRRQGNKNVHNGYLALVNKKLLPKHILCSTSYYGLHAVTLYSGWMSFISQRGLFISFMCLFS